MPRYYFDIEDGERRVRDEDGIVLAGQQEAVDEVAMILHNLGVAAGHQGRGRIIRLAVRDEKGEIVYRASITPTFDVGGGSETS